MRALFKIAWLAGCALLVYLATLGGSWFVGKKYEACLCEGDRHGGKSCSVDAVDRNFFALQTITTTGYGAEVELKSTCVKELANTTMTLGSFIWGLSIAAFWAVLVRRMPAKKPAKVCPHCQKPLPP